MAVTLDNLSSVLQQYSSISSTNADIIEDNLETLFDGNLSDTTSTSSENETVNESLTSSTSNTQSSTENIEEELNKLKNGGLIYTNSDSESTSSIFNKLIDCIINLFKNSTTQEQKINAALTQLANSQASSTATSSVSSALKSCSKKASSCGSSSKSSCKSSSSKCKSTSSSSKSNSSKCHSSSSSSKSTNSSTTSSASSNTSTTSSASGLTGLSGSTLFSTTAKKISGSDSSKISALKSKFDSTYSQNAGLENARNSDINGMYNEYISCESLVEMYKATGDTKYVDQAVALCDSYIAAGKDMNGDGYLDWKASVISQGYNHDHYEWRAADGVAMVVNQLMTDPALKDKYASKAQKYESFVEKNVWEKWSNTRGRCGSINDVPSEEHFIARIGQIALNMYNCTGDQKYLNWIKKEVPALKSAIEKNGDITGTINGGSIDSGHAADTADFIVDCYKAGLVFDSGDISTLVAACKKRGNPAGWVKLAEFDSSLYQSYSNQLNGSLPRRTAANIIGNLADILAET